MSYQYSYLILDLVFLVVWLGLFLWRKDVRKEMLIMSSILGIIALLLEPLCVKDWWSPETITGTIPGIETFLFGFVIGGIAAVIYEELFKKKIRIRKTTTKREKKENINFSLLIIILTLIFVVGFYLFNMGTFNLSTFLLSIGILIIYIQRKDLILDSLVSGGLLLVLSFVVYSVIELITPGWVQAFWQFKNVPNIVILNVPIDDIIWFFLIGAFLGPLYEYWKERRLVKNK